MHEAAAAPTIFVAGAATLVIADQTPCAAAWAACMAHMARTGVGEGLCAQQRGAELCWVGWTGWGGLTYLPGKD